MDKRRFQRINFKADVSFVRLAYGIEGQGKIRDLALGGIFLENPTQYPELNEILEITLSLENYGQEMKVLLKGEVVRVEEGKGIAIKFLEIDPQSFNHLKNILYFNSPDPDKVWKEIQRFLGEAYPLFRQVKFMKILGLKKELMPYLLERAFLYSPEKPFKLSSGKQSAYYLDCRKITLYSPSFVLVSELFWEEIRFSFVEGVAGMSIGADPIVCGILAKAYEEGVHLEGLLIRKEPKKYGTLRQIEGNVKPGMEVLLVEDVVTTGSSVLKALHALREAQVKVLKVLALVDRLEGGREAIEREGVPFQAFFTIEEIISAYQKKDSLKS